MVHVRSLRFLNALIYRLSQWHWLRYTSGGLILLSTLCLWLLLLHWQTEQLAQLTLVQEQAVAAEIESNLNSRIAALERMAQRWEVAGRTPDDQWQADAKAYLQDEPGYGAIAWLDAQNQVRQVVSAANFEPTLLPRILPHHPVVRPIITGLRQTHLSQVTSNLEVAPGVSGFLVLVPLNVKPNHSTDRVTGETPGNTVGHTVGNGSDHQLIPNTQFDGAIVGIFRIDTLIDRMLRQMEQADLKVAIWHEHELVYTQQFDGQSPPDASHQYQVDLKNTEWI